MKTNLKKPMITLLLILFIPFLINCEEKTIVIDGGTHAFSGFVRDSISGISIDSAWIDIGDSILPHHTYTDTNGYYILRVQTKEQINIFCGKNGYYTKDTAIRVITDLDSINFLLDVE